MLKKHKILAIGALISLAALSHSQAANVIFENTTGGAPVVQNSSGTALDGVTTSFASAYIFTGSVPTTISELQSIGNTGLIGNTPLVNGSNIGGGIFQVTPTLDYSVANQVVYLVIGLGGADVGSATELALINTGLTSSDTDISNPTLDLGSYTLSAANVTNSIGTTTGGNIQLAAVPEPSSTLLLGLGAIGLLRRRR